MKSFLCFLAVVIFACNSFLYAEEEFEEEEEVLSGRELLGGCEEGAAPGAPNQYCMQYVFGLVQVVDSFQQMDPDQKVFCINPHQVSLQEVTEKTTEWLKNVPDRLNEDAYKLVTEALHDVYPCHSQRI
jgi:hypothetical protein